EAARRQGVLFGVAQVFRFNESVRTLRDWVADERIGRLVFARAEFSFFADSIHPRSWLYDATVAGGGPILDLGVHCIDALRFILADEVRRVFCVASSDDRSGTVEAAACLTLEFSRGAFGSVMLSFRAPYRTPIELVGERGTVRANDGLNVEHPVEVEFLRDGAVLETKATSNRLAYGLQVDAFAEAIEGKAQFPIPGEEGWRNQQILDAALRSAASARVEEVPPINPDHSH
ncbi:MAG: Gfo/Idh/MocA family oxidoreductase, partial [Acidobacteria bacterium]|nr:Gfo/Idh/MocA family oxidoreductase [Acidobacteriota bacterium]